MTIFTNASSRSLSLKLTSTRFKSISTIVLRIASKPGAFLRIRPCFEMSPQKKNNRISMGPASKKEGQWKFHRIVKLLGLGNKPRIGSTRSVYDRLTNYVYTDTPSPRFCLKNVVGRVCVTIRVNRNGDSVLLEQIKKGPSDGTFTYRTPKSFISRLCNGRPCELRWFSKYRRIRLKWKCA